ncbi:TPA: hypothetical protein KOR75_001161 [Clostridioides difficile]|nr:hypothetical protein [Clostridioides difficile]
MRIFKSLLIVQFAIPFLVACSLPLQNSNDKEKAIEEVMEINESVGVEYAEDDERLTIAKGTVVDYKIIYDSAYQKYSSGEIEIIGKYFIVLKLDLSKDRLVVRISEDDYKNTVVGDYVEITYNSEDNKCKKLSVIRIN